MSVAERLAARKAANAQSRQAKAKAGKTAQVAASEASPCSPSESQRTKWKLSENEQRVIKTGIRQMHVMLTPIMDNASFLQFPKRPNGSSKLLRESYFRRLLSKDVQLRSSTAADVLSAQSDLRHLRLEQLLALRVDTLDFATASESHNAHNNFLNTLDRHLFEQIAKKNLEMPAGSQLPLASDLFYMIGLQMVLALGAAAILSEDAASGGADSGQSALVPTCWALSVEGWPGCKLALFHSTQLKVCLLVGDSTQEVVDAAGLCSSVAVIWDRSGGLGKDRMMHWDVAAVDLSTEDLLAVHARAQRVKIGKGRSLGKELEATLKRREGKLHTVGNSQEHSTASSPSKATSPNELEFQKVKLRSATAPDVMLQDGTSFPVTVKVRSAAVPDVILEDGTCSPSSPTSQACSPEAKVCRKNDEDGEDVPSSHASPDSVSQTCADSSETAQESSPAKANLVTDFSGVISDTAQHNSEDLVEAMELSEAIPQAAGENLQAAEEALETAEDISESIVKAANFSEVRPDSAEKDPEATEPVQDAALLTSELPVLGGYLDKSFEEIWDEIVQLAREEVAHLTLTASREEVGHLPLVACHLGHQM